MLVVLLLDALFWPHLPYLFPSCTEAVFGCVLSTFLARCSRCTIYPKSSQLPFLAGCLAVSLLSVMLSEIWDMFAFSSLLFHVFGYLSSLSLYSCGACPRLYLGYTFRCTPFLIAKCIRFVSLAHTVSVLGTEITTVLCLPSQRPGKTKNISPSC